MTIRRRESVIRRRKPMIQVRKPSSLVRTQEQPSSVPRTEDFSAARSQVVVTLLGGDQPMRMMKLLRSLMAKAPKLVEEAHVVALVDGSNDQAMKVFKHTPWVDDVVETETLLPKGEAFSRLMSVALGAESRYVLHLEEGWECSAGEDSWFHKAIHLVENDGVGQVRLRNAKDHVMSTNALTHQKIHWDRSSDGVAVAKDAHFTFEPSLLSAVVMQGLHPCADEVDAMHKYAVTRLPVAQLSPGAFSSLVK